MTPIERQILLNQREIMDFLLYPNNPEGIIECRNITDSLFNPKTKEEDCCDMSEKDAIYGEEGK